MCYVDWDDGVVGRWEAMSGVTCQILLAKLRGILRISFSTRASRDNIVNVLDTITDESVLFVDADTRFPKVHMAPTSTGPISILLGQIHSAASWVHESESDTNRSNVELSYRRALKRLIRVLTNPYGDIYAHLVYNRLDFENTYGLHWTSDVVK